MAHASLSPEGRIESGLRSIDLQPAPVFGYRLRHGAPGFFCPDFLVLEWQTSVHAVDSGEAPRTFIRDARAPGLFQRRPNSLGIV